MSQSKSISLDNIPVRFINRQWMKLHGLWRCTVELPSGDDHKTLAPVLSGMLEGFFNVTIKGSVTVKIHPCQIIDVPSKGKKFFLVVEANAAQSGIGPYLTSLTGEGVKLTISPCEQPRKAKEVIPGDVSKESLQGLHVLFSNPKFQKFIDQLTGKSVTSKEECKAYLKEYMDVDSCREFSEATVSGMMKGFNEWINRGSS